MSEPRLLKLPNEVLDAILAYLPRIELNSLRAAGRELKSQVERYAQQSTAENDTTSDEPSRDREEAYTIDGLAQATQLEESSEEAQAADVIRLEVWDRTTSKSAAIALRKERDEMVDAWCSEYVERRMGHVSKSNADLAIAVAPRVKSLFATASNGTFTYQKGVLRKKFPFRGSIRDVFLQVAPKGLKSLGFDQLLDGVLAILFHLAAPSVIQAFRDLSKSIEGSIIDLPTFAADLPPARPARVDGVYLRYVSDATAKKYKLEGNFGPYIGISMDVGKRQKGHDCYIPVNKLMAEAVALVPASEWESRLVWQCGPTGLSELPKPVALMIESMLICTIGTTRHAKPVQVDLFDKASYNPARYKAYSEASIQDACESVWDHLVRKVQECPSKKLILPARNSDWHRTWSSTIRLIVCRYPHLTVRRVIEILFHAGAEESTCSQDRYATIEKVMQYKKDHPIPASLFALAQTTDIVRKKDQSGERLTIFRNHPINPIPASSLPLIHSALALASKAIDAFVDTQDCHPTAFRRPDKHDREGNNKR